MLQQGACGGCATCRDRHLQIMRQAALLTRRRLRLSWAASVFCAARSTRTLPSNTPRPVPAATMHLLAHTAMA